MMDIPGYTSFAKVEPISKGWSSDQKYRVDTYDGQRLLLRVAGVETYERKKSEHEMLGIADTLGIPMARPVDFGLCDDGNRVYQLLTWVDGEDAEAALPTLTQNEQYALGLKAGELLKKIHSISAPKGTEEWSVRFDRKVQTWMNRYHSKKEVHSKIGEMLIRYLKDNQSILTVRPQTFIHGDFNTENMIVMPNGQVGVIDFNSYNSAYGDPWVDLDNVSWVSTMFPHFYSGQIYGYFKGSPSLDFWRVFSYYLAYDALAALTDPQDLNGIEDGSYVVSNILDWTDHLSNPIPSWYIEGSLRSTD